MQTQIINKLKQLSWRLQSIHHLVRGSIVIKSIMESDQATITLSEGNYRELLGKQIMVISKVDEQASLQHEAQDMLEKNKEKAENDVEEKAQAQGM